MVKEKILITIDRDIMWDYFLYYKKKNPRIRSFPFAKKISEKQWKANGDPKLTKGGKQQVKSRSRKLDEITKECLMYKVLSLNDLLPIDSMNYKNKKEKWGNLGEYLASINGLSDRQLTNCVSEIRVESETKAHVDADNLGGAFKLLGDGLYLKSGFLIDDNYMHVNPFIVSCLPNKEYPHMEIRMTVIDESVRDIYEKTQLHINAWKK